MKISSSINNRLYPLNTRVLKGTGPSTTASHLVNNNQKYIPENKTGNNQLSEKKIEQYINNKYNAINSQGLSIFEFLKMLLDKGVPMSIITEILVGFVEGHNKKIEESEKEVEKGLEKELVKELDRGLEEGIVNAQKQ
ncbi:hypothetical protein CN423_26750 [Bacillus cereus]|nr:MULTISPECIES: hypothetical protein [Bacillus cereus group]PEQ27854.1 hypothetical protein CN466_27045 [Bacillus cereus]PEQ74009.1 hypothetical protein CN482_30425 [Bacillus cereus]PES08502.1 hypothetical protein CN501_26845 [Bacillus cereus]PES20884.1 hypothetical protein CN496_30925 [Bacillus cereus]PET75951.1 hypothetical protein CN528_25475 [Bacillus cereus]